MSSLFCQIERDDHTFLVAASAYEDHEWIKRLVSWVATLTEQRPLIKIIGASQDP